MERKLQMSNEEWLEWMGFDYKPILAPIKSSPDLAPYENLFIETLMGLETKLGSLGHIEYELLKPQLDNCRMLLPPQLYIQFADAAVALIRRQYFYLLVDHLDLERIYMHLSTLQETSKKEIENMFVLETAYEKMLFMKYSGILDSLCKSVIKKDGSPHQANIARAMAYLLDESFSNINSYLPDLINDKKKTANNRNLYKPETIAVIIKVLSDSGLDTESAEEKLEQIQSSRKD